MRFTIIFSQLLATAGLMAAPLDSKLLTLIPDDAKFIIGVDLTLYRGSALAEVYPSSLDGITGDRGTDALQQVQQVVVVERDGGSGRGPLFILSGALASL